jgi:rRNA maturation RNase YbeY
MIEFHYEFDFELKQPEYYESWIRRIVSSENAVTDAITYIFCNDDYLLEINKKYLDHDFYTDVISFQYIDNQVVNGDIFISIDRIRENSQIFKVDEEHELRRVMAHGVLHLLGYKDKSEQDALLMKRKENEKLELFHVEC